MAKLCAAELKASLIDRLEAGLDKGDCWLWTGGTTTIGGHVYGRLTTTLGGKSKVYVHRLAYRLWVGPLAQRARVVQVCGHSLCCRPEHLYPSLKSSANL